MSAQRYHFATSRRMSVPTTSAKRVRGWRARRCSSTRTVLPTCGSRARSFSTVDTFTRESPFTARRHIRTRSSNGASSFPNACRYVGRSHTSSTSSVTSTHHAAITCATWGGLNEPPSSATRRLFAARLVRGAPPLSGFALARGCFTR